MIKLPKRPSKPQRLRSRTVQNAKRRLHYSVDKGKKLVVDSLWLHDDVRTPLYDHHKGKCCYCERKRDPKREPDIEHFRPKAKVSGETSHQGYWWLAYTWSNLYFACRTCNQEYKRNYFPIEGKRARTPQDSLAAEKPLLLDPVDDDPEQHLHYDWEFGTFPLAKVVGSDERGRATVDVLGLDRDSLNEERGALLTTLDLLATKMKLAIQQGNSGVIASTQEEIREATSAKRPFAGLSREYFRKFNLGHYIAQE